MNYDPGPIPNFLDRTKLVYSYTNLNCYENVCPHQFYHRYILKSTPFVETKEMKHGTAVHEALEKRLKNIEPLPPGFLQWEPFAIPFDRLDHKTELKLAIRANGSSCDFWAKDVWLRGKLDVAAFNGGTSAYLNDWKTGNPNYEDRFELDIGALMLHAANPHLTTIKGTYTWLRENRLGEVHDLSETRHAWTKVTGIVKRIERDRQTGQFEKRKSGLCGYCSVESCEHHFVARPK